MITKRAARQKGNKFEIEIAKLLSELSGSTYRRVPLSGGLHQDLPFDVMKIGNKPSIFDNIGNECKNHKTLKIPEWIKQIKEACSDAGLNFQPKWFIAFNWKGEKMFLINEAYFRALNLAKRAVDNSDL